MDFNLRLSQLSTISGIKRHTLNARLKSNFDQSELDRNGANQILLKPGQSNLIIQDRLNSLSGKVVYIGNLKGGVGKTTISYLLAITAASLGIKTCILDLDVQSNLTQQFMLPNEECPVFYDVVEGNTSIDNTIVRLSDNLDLLPSSLRNSLIERSLILQKNKHLLNWFDGICLNHLRSNYELIIADTPPHLTTLNSVFCLCLSKNDHILVPVCAEHFSLMGVEMFLEDVKEIKDSYELSTDEIPISLIMNRFFTQQKSNLELLAKINQFSQGAMLGTIIKDFAKIRDIVGQKLSLIEIKQGREIFEIMNSLLTELKIIKEVV